MSLSLDISRTKDIAVIQCRGRIVFGEETDELRRVLLGLLNETQRIVLVLASIQQIDSSGLGMLVASFISARHREAEIKFAAPSASTRQLFTLTHLNRLFRIYASAEEAITSFYLHPKAAAG